ncbi:hypothetical protein DPX16_14429 [Anabarilius grahami]|uniref:Ig-like domain-containing protein n=1 Tax=Anabarilius grahami TaxID=495550 RepID=A0A3N0XQB1_ANAGA|nr:hypothetical protein DPX16_14429 [Anabarilius grahami]
MYWYRQRQGQTMTLIVFTSSLSKPDYGDSDSNKFSANKTVPERGYLTVNNVESDDSAVYFCLWNQSAERDDMSNAPHLSVSFFVLCLAVTILGKSVVQTPPDLLKKEKEFAEIECSHKVQNYDVIQWYKQSQSIMDLQLMGFLNIGSENKETAFENKIKLKGDGGNNGTLIINDLTLTDSAVYFCAAYYTVLRITSV